MKIVSRFCYGAMRSKTPISHYKKEEDMKIANLKIGTRLWLGFGLVIGLLGMIVVISFMRMNAAETRINNMLEDRYKKIALMNQVMHNVATIHKHMRNALIEGNADGVKRESEAINALRSRNKELLDNFDKIINVPRSREIFNEIISARGNDLAMQKELFALIEAGNNESAKIHLKSKVVGTEQIYIGKIKEMIELQSGKMEEESQLCKEEFAQARVILGISASIAVLLGLFAAWYATRSITVPVSEAVSLARRVADGDLTAKIEVRSSDETGQLLQALKDMNGSLAKIVTEVRASTTTIATKSEEIADGNMSLSSRTEQQASSLEETASSMEELTSTVRQNADNARQASHLANSASNVALKGGAVVSQVVETMGAINESARKIAEIISVIDGIAFQTNILALNAAVEAARAGEQGRGFAVVAAEVRNLAQRSANAAKEIKELIGNSVEKVDAGSKLVDQAGATMDEVVASVKRVTDIIGEITEASSEQSSGIEQINQAITQLDNVTQQNAVMVEQTATAAESMRTQIGTLVQLVNIFRVEGGRQPAALSR